jgi:hypothetical protein
VTAREISVSGKHMRTRPACQTFVLVHDAVVTVGMTGDPDATVRRMFVAELRSLTKVCVGDLIVDLTACTDISSILADLMSVQASCRSTRCRLKTRTRCPDMAAILTDAGIPLTEEYGQRSEHCRCPTIFRH